VSVICTDKTGTLTRNEMMVSCVLTHEDSFTVEGDGYVPHGKLSLDDAPTPPTDHAIVQELARAAALCNDASLQELDGVWTVQGDPMEGALLAFASKMGLNVRKEQALWNRTDTIPFDASHRYMATLNHDHEEGETISVKGAPEQILAMCKDQRNTAGTTKPLDLGYWAGKAEAIASSGQRVLAVAVKSAPTSHDSLQPGDIEQSLTLIGMVGLLDPPRIEAIEAVAECHGAGIRVKMITGDHARTAAAIGREVGLGNPDNVLTGKDLDQMDDTALRQAVMDCDIFARTSPEHKLRLVMALQSHGMTVAMTGDGVNDAPALKRADAGIAMGLKGSAAAREAADLVLADDNFASIAAAVREGRTVYDNIKKVISWTIPTSTGEAVTIIAALLLGMALPVTPVQILWINLITAATLGMALAFEPTEEGTMQRPPRPRTEALISGELAWHIVFVSVLFLCGVFGVYNYAIESGYSLELARTMTLNTLVVMEIFHLFFIRNIYGRSITWKSIQGTRVVWTVVVIVTAAQFAITYLPPLQNIFQTRSISFWDGIVIVGIGVALFITVETEKQLRFRLKRTQ
jgi:magnesium-transporting ATPase (P-type)